ncbi:hypothetical protein B0O80DRAFT_503677 [Mortierella sp. GBAus27b]|nr:hypothetical protein BGX31_008963 [Mortierella sp. GBA43]KAI8346126.1 hypothetical protein B0O80DRAFT_503677 [Mortierella sp. GBAus27b]
MQAGHPMELIDIISAVAIYVQPRDLPNCLLVSRRWHQAFLPLIWKDIALDTPPEASVQAHRHLVRTVEIRKASSHLEAVHLPKLDSIILKYLDYSPIIPQFVMRHPTVSRIEFSNVVMKLNAAIWSTLLGFQYLRELAVCIAGTTSHPLDEKTFWQLCTRLERLRLTSLGTGIHSHSTPNVDFPKMRDLSLLGFRENHRVFCIELMQRCPNLESITWKTRRSYIKDIVVALDPLLQAAAWPHLERLDFSTHQFTSEDLALLINRVPRITTLKIDLYDENILRLNIPQLLLPQFAHLRHIDLNPHGSLHSSMAQEFLSSCPLLETLRAPSIHAQDVAGGVPWVCLRLKVLNLVFRFESKNDELQPLVFNQLSRLVRLEELRILEHYTGQGLKLRLECGLGKLSTLRSLHTIDFEYTAQHMDNPEIDWILEHWKSLRRMKGTRNIYRSSIDRVLTRRLRDHGIEV